MTELPSLWLSPEARRGTSSVLPCSSSSRGFRASTRPGAIHTVGDSYDNALAETVNGLYKTEIIYSKRVWPSATAVEIATLDWVHWWNTARLHEGLGYRTPVEVEAAYTEPEVTAPAVP